MLKGWRRYEEIERMVGLRGNRIKCLGGSCACGGEHTAEGVDIDVYGSIPLIILPRNKNERPGNMMASKIMTIII